MNVGVIYPRNHGSLWGTLIALGKRVLAYFNPAEPLFSYRVDYQTLKSLKISVDESALVDLLWAHPPCGSKLPGAMGYSRLKMRDDKYQKSLERIDQAVNVILEKRPRWWIIESSPKWAVELEEMGERLARDYAVLLVLDVPYYRLGFWLHRERAFLIGGPTWLTRWLVPKLPTMDDYLAVLKLVASRQSLLAFPAPPEYPPLGRRNPETGAWRPVVEGRGFLSRKRRIMVHPVEDRPFTVAEVAAFLGVRSVELMWRSKGRGPALLINRGVPGAVAYWTTQSILAATGEGDRGYRRAKWSQLVYLEAGSVVDTYRQLLEVEDGRVSSG